MFSHWFTYTGMSNCNITEQDWRQYAQVVFDYKSIDLWLKHLLLQCHLRTFHAENMHYWFLLLNSILLKQIKPGRICWFFPFIILLGVSTCCVSPMSTSIYNSIFSINLSHAHFKRANLQRHSCLGIRTGYLSVVSELSLKLHVGYSLEKYLIFYLHFQVFPSFSSLSVQILRNITMPSCKKKAELMNRLKFRTRDSRTIFWNSH